jgi:hypothetical protein
MYHTASLDDYNQALITNKSDELVITNLAHLSSGIYDYHALYIQPSTYTYMVHVTLIGISLSSEQLRYLVEHETIKSLYLQNNRMYLNAHRLIKVSSLEYLTLHGASSYEFISTLSSISLKYINFKFQSATMIVPGALSFELFMANNPSIIYLAINRSRDYIYHHEYRHAPPWFIKSKHETLIYHSYNSNITLVELCNNIIGDRKRKPLYTDL